MNQVAKNRPVALSALIDQQDDFTPTPFRVKGKPFNRLEAEL